MNAVRPAAVAGMFYPGDAKALAADIDELLGGVDSLAPRLGFPKALVVPHAGYIYSGAVAAHAYDELWQRRAACVRRVVLLGPVHRVAVRGLALPSAEAFDTPLGTDPHRPAKRGNPCATCRRWWRATPAHALEHSLEVQLPFLQKQLGDFSLVPFAVGSASVEQVAAVIERLWGGPETLIVISTDLSHYHAYETARAVDQATVARIAARATDLDHEEACGATPLNGFLAVGGEARPAGKAARGVQFRRYRRRQGPGGGLFGFCAHEGGEVSLEQAGADAAFARARRDRRETVRENAIGLRLPLARPGRRDLRHPDQGRPAARLHRQPGRRAPLGDDMAENALGAAFRDPRFPALTREEWPQCRVEVSLLSTPKPLRFADEADLLAQIVPGEDGLILEADGKRGTFLPQVWEGIPDKRPSCASCVKKAGLPPDTRLGRCKVSRYRVAKLTHEG